MDNKKWINGGFNNRPADNPESRRANKDKFQATNTPEETNPFMACEIPLSEFGIDDSLFQKTKKKKSQDEDDEEKLLPCVTPEKRAAAMKIRVEIYRRIMHEATVNKRYKQLQDNLVLSDLMELYDRFCFNNQLRAKLASSQQRQLVLQWGGDKFNKPGIAGYCESGLPDRVILAFHTDIATVAIDSDSGDSACGILCLDQLACLQVILEHEVIHVIINACLRKAGSHNFMFKALAKQLFAHLDFRHEIGRGNGREKVKALEEIENKRVYLRPGLVVSVTDTAPAMGAISSALSSKKAKGKKNTKHNRFTVMADQDEKTQYRGVIVEVKENMVTVLSAKETIIHNIPIQTVTLLAFIEQSDACCQGPKALDPAEWKALYELWHLFLEQKKLIELGHEVIWTDPDSRVTRRGIVVSRRSITADVQCSTELKCAIPYFRLVIASQPAPTPSEYKEMEENRVIFEDTQRKTSQKQFQKHQHQQTNNFMSD